MKALQYHWGRELFAVVTADPWAPIEECGLNKRGALVWVSSGLDAAAARLVGASGACRRAVPGVSRTCPLACPMTSIT